MIAITSFNEKAIPNDFGMAFFIWRNIRDAIKNPLTVIPTERSPDESGEESIMAMIVILVKHKASFIDTILVNLTGFLNLSGLHLSLHQQQLLHQLGNLA